MTPQSSDPLSDAAGLLRKGDKLGARRLLFGFVKQNTNSEQGWLMLGLSMDDPMQQAECFRRVLTINPDNNQARQQLEQANTAAAPATLRQSLGAERRRPASSAPPPVSSPISTNQFYSEAPGEPVPLTSPPAKAPSSSTEPAGGPAAPAPQTAAAYERPAPRTRKSRNRWLILAAVFVPVFCLIFLGGCYVFSQMASLSTPAQLPATPAALAPASPTPFRMPATWTPTPRPSATPYQSPTPVSPTPTNTLMPPVPTDVARMERIQQEVADLRGLSMLEPVEQYLVTRDKAEVFLRGLLINDQRIQMLDNEARALSALGLIKPTYDLVTYSLNGIADGIGGVYISWTHQLLVIIQYAFTGMQHLIYAHEFDHALVDQHFDMNKMGVFPDCLSNAQRCQAIQALVEGDATVLEFQWLKQYATPADQRDMLLYSPPAMLLPDQSPPPFAEPNLRFPYDYGQKFVQYLYDSGNWETVNQAYQRLPDSTEQIIHPEKYLTAEAPMPVADPTLESVFGPEWRVVKQDSLGEWITYMILAYNADVEAQIDREISKAAAAGWGGDHYQVYAGPDGRTVLAVHWAWDTPQDAQEFDLAIGESVARRFHQSRIDSPAGTCWKADLDTSCVFTTDMETLWLIAPNLDTIEKIRALYPAFRQVK